jgi:hypothetical protein
MNACGEKLSLEKQRFWEVWAYLEFCVSFAGGLSLGKREQEGMAIKFSATPC